MKISSRFSIAVHILSLCDFAQRPLHLEWIVSSVGTNPVIIRRILGQLKKAGLVTVRAGSGGAFLAKSLDGIDLLEVYRAVDVVEEGKLFHIHEEPNPQCQVGANIQAVLQLLLARAQEAMENILAGITMEELVTVLAEQIKSKA